MKTIQNFPFALEATQLMLCNLHYSMLWVFLFLIHSSKNILGMSGYYGERGDKKGCRIHNYKENKNLTCCICSSTKISLFKLGKTSLLSLLSRSVTHIAKKIGNDAQCFE